MEERITKKHRTMKRLITLFIMALCVCTSFAQDSIERHTLHYATHEGEELMLDLYRTAKCDEAAPCMIFAFGGGFVGGDRAREYYIPYFETLARNGIVVASIDYRLGLKNLGSDVDMRGMIVAMKRSVDIAVEDMYTATRYIIDHASELGIDTSKIMISGSSAGAITALQAEWGRTEGIELAKILPEEFRYAGVVACAGALFSTSGSPKFKEQPAPMLLFHGTSDSNVPYNKASFMGIGFYGSKYITKQLDKLKSPYHFYSVEYGDHSIAGTPLFEQTDLILQFISDYVIHGRRLCIKSEVSNLDAERRPTHFTVKEYLSTNYAN